MRIGLDARFLAQPGSGVNRYLVNLLHWLPRLAPQHHYFLYWSVADRVPDASWPPLFQARPIVGPASLYSFSPGLRRALRQDQLDVFHATAYTLPWRAPCPTVLTLHDLTFEVQPAWYGGALGRLFRLYIRHSAARADRVLADSEATRRDILHYYRLPPERVVTIHLGGAEPAFVPRDRDAARQAIRALTGIEPPYLLYVGGLHERKNIPRLIEAFGRARQARAFSHQLLLTGPGSAAQRAALSQLAASHGLAGRVHLLPPVSEADLPTFYAAADAFIYPSLYEGFGLPTLEAMACGTPVITSRSSSLAEVVGTAGVLADPTDTEALAGAIASLLTDVALRTDLAARGLERARHFSWETCARETLAAYDSVQRTQETR